MVIRFRCPQCNHKIRARGAAAGKQTNCKCGADIVVPAVSAIAATAEHAAPTAQAWRSQSVVAKLTDDRGGSSVGRLVQVALRPPRAGRGASHCGVTWRGLLAGAAVSFVVCLAAIGVFFLTRSAAADIRDRHLPTGARASEQSLNTEVKTRPAATSHSPKSAPMPQGSAPSPPPPRPKEPAPSPPPPPPVLTRPEPPTVAAWNLAAKIDVVGDGGKAEQITAEPNMILLAVHVHLPGKMLQGTVFNIDAPDIQVIVGAEKIQAIAYSFPDVKKDAKKSMPERWFAPTKGKYRYLATGETVTQGWLFYVPAQELTAHGAQFQFRNEPTLPLTANLRRAQGN